MKKKKKEKDCVKYTQNIQPPLMDLVNYQKISTYLFTKHEITQ